MYIFYIFFIFLKNQLKCWEEENSMKIFIVFFQFFIYEKLEKINRKK